MGVFDPLVFDNQSLDASPLCTPIVNDTWGGSWCNSWGTSWARAFVAPTPPTPPAFVSDGGYIHRGSEYWRRLRAKAPSKKKKRLIDELEELAIELRARADEAPSKPAEAAVERAYVLAESAASTAATEIAQHVARMRAIIEELDDEEILMLAIH